MHRARLSRRARATWKPNINQGKVTKACVGRLGCDSSCAKKQNIFLGIGSFDCRFQLVKNVLMTRSRGRRKSCLRPEGVIIIVLIIDNGPYPRIIRQGQWIRNYLSGMETDIFHAVQNRFPYEPERYSGVILTGGTEPLFSNAPWVTAELKLIERCADRNIPLLGICHGHQLIGRALIGDHAVREKYSPEFGWKKFAFCIRTARFFMEFLRNSMFIARTLMKCVNSLRISGCWPNPTCAESMHMNAKASLLGVFSFILKSI